MERRVIGLCALLLALPGFPSGTASAQTELGLGPISSGGVQAPKELSTVTPEYPKAMRASGIGAIVVIDFTVDVTGKVVDPVVESSNNPAFEEPALQAILQWKYKPAMEDGQPVESKMEQTLQFQADVDEASGLYNVDVEGSASPGFNPAHVVNSQPVVFPYELERRKVWGDAKVRMFVDESGKVHDVKIVSSSQPEFGYALAAAAQGFEFSPAVKQGRPVPSIVDMTQNFDPTEMPEPDGDRLFLLEKQPGGIHPASGLDIKLHPMSARHPLYPLALVSNALTGDAVVEFLIQEDGAVRFPRIVRASRPEFGYAAVEAVSSWLFNPPKVNGEGVVTRARVELRFKPRQPVPGAK